MIVSCVYSHLNKTIIQGTLNRKTRYYNGLVYLSNNNEKKIIYTCKEEIDVLKKYIQDRVSEEAFNLFEFIIQDPFKLPYHETIQKLKKEKPKEQKGRATYLEIQYAKFKFIKDNLYRIKDTNENIWWIDAGLIDTPLFPQYYMKNEIDRRNILDSQFFLNLNKIVNNNFFVMVGDRQHGYGHGTPNKNMFEQQYQARYHPIGGFWGGKYEVVNNIIDKFINKTKFVLDNSILYSEEIIMEIVFSENIELFKLEFFDTWYHESTPFIKDNSYFKNRKSFYKIFENIKI